MGHLFGRRLASSSAFLGRVTFEVDEGNLAVVGARELSSLRGAKGQTGDR